MKFPPAGCSCGWTPDGPPPGVSPHDRSAPLVGLGELCLAQKRPADAIPYYEQVLALTGGDDELGGDVRLDLADALWQTGKDRPRARSLVEEALARAEHDGNREAMPQYVKWLAEHKPKR